MMLICRSHEEAWPRLRRHNFPATIFVATRPIDIGLRGYMNWDQLREMQANGFDIGSQTRSHPHMHLISPEEVDDELSSSNDRFIAELGMRPDLFAYPYGEYNLAVVDAVKNAGFVAAFGQNSGIMNGYDGFYELPRFAMNEQFGTMERLELAINGLPLKVNQVTPADMVLEENPPIYGFTLAPDMDQQDQLRCFNSTYGKLEVTVLGRRAEVRLPGPLTGKPVADQLHHARARWSMAVVWSAISATGKSIKKTVIGEAPEGQNHYSNLAPAKRSKSFDSMTS